MSAQLSSNPMELGGEKQQESDAKEKQQLLRLLDARTINTLPLHSPHNYSPHFNLEFDLLVQDYCRNQNNLIKLSKCSESFAHRHQQHFKKNKAPKSMHQPAGLLVRDVTRTCKVVVTGDVAVGKTCLVNRFGHAIYSSTYQTTIGVDFDLQRFNILGLPYVLQVSSLEPLQVLSLKNWPLI